MLRLLCVRCLDDKCRGTPVSLFEIFDMMQEFNPWKTLSQRRIYENPWFRVREDQVIRPDGTRGIYGVVEMPPSVGIVALDEKQEVQLVGQWRYCLGRYSWEVPTGSCEWEEEPLGAARRELQEETGLVARMWHSLGWIDNSNAATTDVAHLFLATGIEMVSARPDPVEKLESRKVPLAECLVMVLDGRITDSTSVAAILKADHSVSRGLA